MASFAIVPFMTMFFVTQFGLQIAGMIGDGQSDFQKVDTKHVCFFAILNE